jgi:hypothetical protein
MQTWFFENYEDPVENTPYESAEGGFQYIWGGPFDAHQELDAEFSGIVPDDLIQEFADKLSDIAAEWTSAHHEDEDSSDQFDNYLIGSIDVGSEHKAVFQSSISDILSLLGDSIAASRKCLYRLLYVNVITALECYLSDFLVSHIRADAKLLRKLVETTPAFKEQKITVSDVFQTMEVIEKRANSYLAGLVWHRLDRVSPLYENTLGVKLPSDLRALLSAIVVRHELVHRNGKKPDGTEHEISEADIMNLIKIADELVNHIEKEWLELPF